MEINSLADRAYNAAKARGHYQDDTGITAYLAMVHTELGRCMDACRRNDSLRMAQTARPSGPDAHLADAAIRIMTLSRHHGLDIETPLRNTIAKNSGHQPEELNSAQISSLAWENYAHNFGDPSRDTIDEMMWDGHQVIAHAGNDIVSQILELETNGVRTREANHPTRQRIAYPMAGILIWLLATGHQREIDLPALIAQTINWDENNPGR